MASPNARTGALAIRSDSDKPVVNPPAPGPIRQGFTTNDAAAIAGQAYTAAFNATSGAAAQQIAGLALQKIAALVPGTTLAVQIVPYAQAVLQTPTTDDQNAKRVALWPLLYISKGLVSSDDPTFYELTAKVMQSMLNWNDGLAVGLATLNYLDDSPNGYVKTMVLKALASYRNPGTNIQGSYNVALTTLQEIGTTLAAIKK